jgi:hypothetical protein
LALRCDASHPEKPPQDTGKCMVCQLNGTNIGYCDEDLSHTKAMKDINADVEEGMKGFNRCFQSKATDYISTDLLFRQRGSDQMKGMRCCAPRNANRSR